MNDQQQHFENDPERHNRQTTYSYVFSNGVQQPQTSFASSQRGKGSRAALVVIAVLLCATLSFAAGFGGFLFARGVWQTNAEDATEENTKFDDPQAVLTDDPESILDKSESHSSIYGSAGEDVFAVSGVVRMVQDAVVVIDVTIASSPIFGGSSAGSGSGSGVIVSADGYVLTCHHVVDGADSVEVTLNDGTKFDAMLVGSDEASDLAMLKIDAGEKTLVHAAMGCSEDLVVGESVVAIGNPLGTLGGTVTTGIISATERNIKMSDGSVMTLIQTDTAINSGNSGGGLFNLDGQLIGIVNAKYSASGVEGLAFAIPIDSAYPVQKDLMKYGYVRGIVDHGLSVLEVTDANIFNYYHHYGITEKGVYIVESEYTDELKNSDRILSVNGEAISTASQLEETIDSYKVGDTVTIKVARGSQTLEVELTLQEYVPDRLKNYLS